MSIYEYDEEKVLAMIRQDEREDGIAEGRTAGIIEGTLKGKIDSILELLDDLGTLPEAIKQKFLKKKILLS